MTVRLPVTDTYLPGRELCRVATVNDVHIGHRVFGVFGGMHEPPAAVPHAERCLRSAVQDALQWGAQLLIVKGDLTHHSRPGEWAVIGDVLADLPVPVVIVQGNHEVKPARPTEALAGLRRHGLHLVEDLEVVDLPGLRVIAADTTIDGQHHGQLAPVQDAVAGAAAGADGAVLVCLHHNLQRHQLPTFWPPGVPGAESRAFLRALRAANPRCLVVTGHTHRHRRHVWEGVTWSEVGSTKDYPGTWAGYVAHERGIRQVVHHVSDPSVQAWLSHTRWAAGGIWGLWSPGRLGDRCFSITW